MEAGWAAGYAVETAGGRVWRRFFRSFDPAKRAAERAGGCVIRAIRFPVPGRRHGIGYAMTDSFTPMVGPNEGGEPRPAEARAL